MHCEKNETFIVLCLCTMKAFFCTYAKTGKIQLTKQKKRNEANTLSEKDMKENEKRAWEESADKMLEKAGVTEAGLTEEQAELIRKEKGENVLSEGKKKSIIQIFLSQFLDLLVIILIIAAIVSMLSGSVESTFVIFAVLILNAFLGTVQHD